MIHLASLLKQHLRHEGCVSVVIEMTNLLFNLHFQAYIAETSKACLTGKISSQKGTQWFNTFHSPKELNYSNQPKVTPLHRTVNQVIIKEKKKVIQFSYYHPCQSHQYRQLWPIQEPKRARGKSNSFFLRKTVIVILMAITGMAGKRTKSWEYRKIWK